MDAKEYLRHQLKQSSKKYFGIKDDAFIENVTAAWMNDSQESKFRFESILKHAQRENQLSLKILDMASGRFLCLAQRIPSLRSGARRLEV